MTRVREKGVYEEVHEDVCAGGQVVVPPIGGRRQTRDGVRAMVRHLDATWNSWRQDVARAKERYPLSRACVIVMRLSNYIS